MQLVIGFVHEHNVFAIFGGIRGALYGFVIHRQGLHCLQKVVVATSVRHPFSSAP
jgi:hypothetical protein